MRKKISPRESNLNRHSKRQKSRDDSLTKKKLSDFGFQAHFYRPPEYVDEVEDETEYKKAVKKYGNVAQMHWELFP